MNTAPSDIVPALLAAAGLTVSAEEQARLIAEYPAWRARMDTLYALPEARYESPAPVFGAQPGHTSERP
ncbi:hypothetical protein [Sciscionella marina]|uniref:hypothetical protein n=1 Tax=Sciscionella marina TaxID=508770 RepID=UPI00037F7E18|nr:hypothetical protein [Sciscionella marina]